MLVGIPNVGKSALANSLHQIGRISAAGNTTFFSCLSCRNIFFSFFFLYILFSEIQGI